MIHTSTPGDGDFSGWLMYHSVGVFPGQKKAITEALASFTASWCAPDDQRWDIALNARSALLANWATLIGANPADVFGAQNVTEAFARFIDGLDDNALRGRTVLAAADCFPSLHFLLAGLAERRGFTLRTVAVRDGEAYVHDDDFIAAWTPDVALALVTWVSSLTSKRVDLETLAAHAQRQASLVAVDLTQGMGILPFDVRTTAVDFACGSTLKWLCGAPGTGLGYVSPAPMKRGMRPATRGWFSQENPFNWDIEAFSYAPDARRFDTGTPSVLPFIASKPGFDWMLAQPAGSVRVHNLNLCHQIIEMVDRLEYRLLSPRDDQARGGSIMAELPRHADAGQVISMLASQRVSVDARGRTLRMSPGASTTSGGIERLERCLSQ
ncbi:aminotransferase V [Caballeronia mineralivorans PML1(12)]|uniref:Aminotransferase V n=1 Tax=Caballeronia mineralivorans PML1(12) TaxID=908627 RepID=A0A0J1G206_9BURK|nr:aminotransferase class V-fold PLP-dependent enzyme [Caballeronia mineralivorans]KLU26203.1 aminotransferase V [Caballeronia mineralivorans PML1(12)]